MTEILLHNVTRTVAPEGIRRDRAVSARGMAEGSAARYDFDTLFYEVIRHGPDLHVVAPKLLNFGPLVKRTRFAIDGQPLPRPKIRNFYRHSTLRFASVPAGSVLELTFPDGQTATAPIRDAQLGLLQGLDCELILSKNDDLGWITDRLRFHVETQGVRGLVFIDNGSDAYDLDTLRDRLGGVGLDRVVLMSVPYPYGPLNRKPTGIELYLQTSVYNIARLLFLQGAGGVLCMDNDEVLIPGDRTMFDRARAARLGFVAFHGENRYPHPDTVPPFGFTDHDHTPSPAKRAPTKWCLDPSGPLGRMQWRGHNLENNHLRRFQTLNGTHYYHCLGITTGWKSARRFRASDALQRDPKTERFWQGTFAPALR